MSAELKMDNGKINSKIKNRVSELVQARLDTQVLKDSNYYAPEDTGFLKASGITGSKIGSGVLEWSTPYAREQYYGRPNKSKDRNPNARMKWFEGAKAVNLQEWINLANEAYEGK